MPIPVAPLIAAGATLVGSGANAYSQGRTNKKTREHNNAMFEKEKQRDIEFWNMQNSYNDPSEQRKRLENAGLNPHLMYGNGASAGVASAPNTSSAQSWNPRAPEIDASSATQAYFDVASKQAQTDNLKVQNDVLTQEVALKQAQTAATLSGAAKTGQETQQAAELFKYTMDGAKENVRKTVAETDVLLNRNEREALQTSQSLQEGLERVLTMRANRSKIPLEKQQLSQTIAELMKNNELKQLDINLRKKGINPTDPTWMRIIGQALADQKGVQKGIEKGVDSSTHFIRKLFNW